MIDNEKIQDRMVRLERWFNELKKDWNREETIQNIRLIHSDIILIQAYAKEIDDEICSMFRKGGN